MQKQITRITPQQKIRLRELQAKHNAALQAKRKISVRTPTYSGPGRRAGKINRRKPLNRRIPWEKLPYAIRTLETGPKSQERRISDRRQSAGRRKGPGK